MGVNGWGFQNGRAIAIFFSVMTTLAVAPAAWSATSGSTVLECDRIQMQLQQMQKAQGLLLESMAKKNDSLAGTLDHFADDLSSHEQKPSHADVINLKRSADAFRGHSDRELALIAKFQKKSEELINETVLCLSQTQKLSQNATEGNFR